MLFIFGFGHQKRKTLGPVHEKDCPRCGHRKFWILEKYSEWFTLFFIPIIPTFSEHYIFCPICKERDIISKQEFQELVPLASLNNEVINSNLSQDEYQQKQNEL